MSTDGTPGQAPRPVPDLTPGGAAADVVPDVVTDEERNRYGVLLDHAAERGLLSTSEYQARLAELAESTSVDELRRIVTELPAFGPAGGTGGGPAGGPPGAPGRSAATPVIPDPAALDSALWASLTPARQRRGAGNPWLILAIMVVLLLAAIVVLAVVVSHVGHPHPAGMPPGAGVAFSRLRL